VAEKAVRELRETVSRLSGIQDQNAVMLANARSQLLSYGTVSFAEDLATHAAKTGEEYTVTVANGTVHNARRLILATGVSDDLSTFPGLQERLGVRIRRTSGLAPDWHAAA
jgi:thioredoxin reductase